MVDKASRLRSLLEENKLLKAQVAYLSRQLRLGEIPAQPKGRSRTIRTAVPPEVVADLAWRIADASMALERGAQPDKTFRAFVRRQVQRAVGLKKGRRVDDVTARVVGAMTPGRRGPRPSRLLLADQAFSALADLGGETYRGVRGKHRRLLLATTDPENSDN